jgi:CRISPR-associated Csx10 family RAMP protein
MQTYLLDLTLESPLSVSRGRSASNRQATTTVVPSQTLRGALAAATERAGVGAEARERLFGTEGLRTSALVPAGPEGSGGVPAVAPLTLRTCKRNGGFLADASSQETSPHGVEDALFASLRLALQEDPDGLRALRTCHADGCGHVMTQKGGLVRTDEDGPKTQRPPGKRTQTHVGLDRRRDGAASGMLYAREVVNEKTSIGGEGLRATTYRAIITGEEDHLDRLTEALRRVGEVRVGTALSRGLGRCRIDAIEQRAGGTSVKERVHAFNEAFVEYGGGTDGVLIALTLRTPALFVDSFLRPEPAPGGEHLLQAARSAERSHAEALAKLNRVHEVARSYSFQAWNGLAGMPHATDQGLRAGSVLVYRAPALTDDLQSALAHIEETGIGLRRELGLGHARVCDRLHTDVHEHTNGT